MQKKDKLYLIDYIPMYLSGNTIRKCAFEAGCSYRQMRDFLLSLGLVRSKSEAFKLKDFSYYKGKHFSPATEFKCGTSVSPETQFKLGDIPISKGKTYVELYGEEKAAELKTRLRDSRLSIPKEKHPRWKGGVCVRSTVAEEYKNWRKAVFERDSFICQNSDCEFCKNKRGVILHAHHIKPYADFVELRYNVNNGITYCKDFHLKSGLHKRKAGGIYRKVLECK